jgi:predicted MFS family arabinose efflux permease
MIWHSQEKRATSSLAVLYAIRMLGLFMVMPVMALYAENYEAATPALIGLAIGAYGLTQALLQIPLGWASDRIGRKPIIITGLILFAVGSVVAAMATSMETLILGRIIQGAGAIASTLMALLSDLTREETRTKSMAVIGLSIGFSFVLAMMIGPTLSSLNGLAGLFWLTAAMAILGIGIVIFWVPTPKQQTQHREQRPDTRLFRKVLTDSELLRLNIGIAVLHAVMVALFLLMPHWIETALRLPVNKHGLIYLPVMLIAFALMVPFIVLAESKRLMKPIMLGAIGLLGLSLLAMTFTQNQQTALVVNAVLFFMAFNWLEASLPSLVSKLSPAGAKGTAMGVYSSCQFFGAFIGGAMGGWLIEKWGTLHTLYALAAIVGIWWLAALFMRRPKHLTGYRLEIPNAPSFKTGKMRDMLAALPGVTEVDWAPDESAAYLKVDKALFDPNRANECLRS